MADATDMQGQTPAPSAGMGQTPAPGSGEQQEVTYTKSQLSEMILKEVGKVTAKNAKKLEALQAELEAERKKSLPDPEKVKLEIEERDRKIAEATARLEAFEAKEKKRVALEDAKLSLPADIKLTDLMDMMPGNDEEAIAGYVAKFKKMFPESKALGSTTTQGLSQKKVSLADQIIKLETEMLKLETPPAEKAKLARETIRLKGLLAKGEV